MRQYVYALINQADAPHCAGVEGIEQASVDSIGDGQVAAVISPVQNSGKLRPQRANLAAHQNVLKHLTARITPLPMSFGMVADDVDAVHDLLRRYQADFVEQLARVEGKVEMGLRLKWDVPNIFEYFVSTHDGLREQRDRAFDGGAEPSREEMIAIGQHFSRLLESERERHWNTVEAVLAPHCSEFKRNTCRDEREVLNLACLVPRSASTAFEGAVYEAARRFDDDFLFDYNGPWAPHNFVDLALQL